MLWFRLDNVYMLLFSLISFLAFSFNDRIRDALLGGSPFGHPLQQGFVTGLFLEVLVVFGPSCSFSIVLSFVIFIIWYIESILQPNGHDHGDKVDAERMLAVSKDHIQVQFIGLIGVFSIWCFFPFCHGQGARSQS